MSLRRALAVLLGAALPVAALAAPGPAGAATTFDPAAARGWLLDQQQADGGFELSGFPGFETPDAVLALAAVGQTGTGWDEAEALAAVEAATTDGGADPLDAVDAWVDSVQGGDDATAAAAQAGKVVALVTEPLGLDAGDFDPADDSTAPVDLLAAIEAAEGDGSYPSLVFTAQVYVAWALGALGEPVPSALIDLIEGAQKPNGGFDYSGLPDPGPVDPDTTAVAIIALVVAGEPADGPTVAAARAALGRTQTPTGDWAAAFDDGNPNSTAMVALVAATLGLRVEDPAWRDAADERLAGLPLPSPIRALARWQVDDGHVSSPNDAWGLNTFATAQALQAIAADSGAWPYVVDAGIEAPAVNADRRLVNALYLDLLGRPADAAGAAFWEGELAAGRTPAEVARALTGTREYAIRVAHDGAERYLGGELTAAELDEAVTDVRAGRRTALYGRMLAEGDAPADEWAADLFRLALGREGSDADVAWIVDSVDGGARTRAQAATAVLDSSEGRGRWVSETYRDRLRRHAGAAERAFWVGQLGRGRNPSHLVAQIAGSAEYRSLTLPTVR
ncbi:MAG: DUF4214 domain-containing protein [Acidimicrobiales bacterium]|nr:DUF4214 domain-containing protein [Acidimicrobiales bacterium]